MPDDFKVRVGEFEGPLELLLELIEKRKLHISDVSLSQVADEFIEYVESLKIPEGELAAEKVGESESSKRSYVSSIADFILIASTLLLIKSKSLLPGLNLTEEEQVSIEELERRLEAYRAYKEAAEAISKMFGSFLYFAKERKRQRVIFYPTAEITKEKLHKALLEVFANMPKSAEPLPKVGIRRIISLEEMIDRLKDRIESSLKMSFREFSSMEKAEKIDVIVSFLAMLELVKQGLVRVEQGRHFEDIEIESERAGVPAYN